MMTSLPSSVDVVNVTDKFASNLTRTATLISGVYIIAIIMVSCVGNGAVLVISVRKRKNLKPLDLLTVNLAISDLLVSVIGYPFSSISGLANRWSFGDGGCAWYGFCGFLFGVNGMTTLSAIGVCRYLKLCKRKFDVFKIRSMVKIIGAIWAYSLLWTIPPLFGWSRYKQEPFHTSCTIDWASRMPADQAYVVCVFIFCYFVQLVALLFSYLSIALAVLKRKREIRRQHRVHFTNFWTEVRLIKSSLTVTLAYTVAWTPYAVVSLWAFVREATELPFGAYASAAFLAKSASVYNPLIYTAFNRKFKRELQQLCCCCGCECRHGQLAVNVEAVAGAPIGGDGGGGAEAELASADAKRGLAGLMGRRFRFNWTNPVPGLLASAVPPWQSDRRVWGRGRGRDELAIAPREFLGVRRQQRQQQLSRLIRYRASAAGTVTTSAGTCPPPGAATHGPDIPGPSTGFPQLSPGPGRALAGEINLPNAINFDECEDV